MIDWVAKDELECRVCSKKIDVTELNSQQIEQKLKENNWSVTLTAPACPKHRYKGGAQGK